MGQAASSFGAVQVWVLARPIFNKIYKYDYREVDGEK